VSKRIYLDKTANDFIKTFANDFKLNSFAKKKINMKKFALLMITTLLVISCSKYGEGDFTISGTAKGFKDGTKIYLRQLNEAGMILKSIDSGFVVNQKFVLEGSVEEASIVTLTADNEETNINIVLEKGAITVDLVKGALFNSKISGSYNNDKLRQFNTDFGKLQASVTDKLIVYEEKNRLELSNAFKSGDSATIKKLKSGYEKIEGELLQFSLEFVKKNPKALLSVLILENNMNNNQVDFNIIKSKFEELEPELQKVSYGVKIQDKINAIANTEIGKEAPNFTAKDPKGNEITLHEVLGKKVTIIDFWASWCTPCRVENPNMVKLNKEFKSKGLNIVGVSLDSNVAEWTAAIYADELNWYHASNLQAWQDPIVLSYNIMGIPSTFILDADGKIVAKNLKGEELRKKIIELTK
jgi:peroxiredoxin